MNEAALQAEYYAMSAADYDGAHLRAEDEHQFALYWLSALIHRFEIKSLLDVGSGTGRALRFLSQRHPGLRLMGVEPVAELRSVAYESGLQREQLVLGDATDLLFPADSFDLVCEFGVLHHIKDHRRAAAEMARVAKLGVFLSDSNNFGQGSYSSRAIKQALRAAGLWPLVKVIKTRGRGYHFSKGDGVYYSYSIFDSLDAIRRKFPNVYQMNTCPSGSNLYRTASHAAVFAKH